MSDQDLRIKLLELQIAALRSVLSEWDCDKGHFLQMHAADILAEVLTVIR